MPIPEFITQLRRHVGHDPLWLIGCTAVVLRDGPVPHVLDLRGTGASEDSVPRAGADEGPYVLLVERSDNGRWAPVSGIVDPGEEPHATAVREVWEETRVRCEVARLAWVASTGMIEYPNGDRARYLDHTFACRWVDGEPEVGDDESTRVGWWPVARLDELDSLDADVRARIDAVLVGRELTALGRRGDQPSWPALS